MKRNPIAKKILILILIPAISLINISVCTLLYFFEPITYNAPDLNLSDYSFDLYSKYSNTASDFYIKQISADDIVSAENDIRLKYVKNTILIIASDSVTFKDMQNILSPFGGIICGYIREINFYQAEFQNIDYPSLVNICSKLSENDSIISVVIDYFEETPLSNESITSTENTEYDDYYYELINYPADISDYSINTSEITVGMLDVLIDSSSEHFNVINKNTYSINSLNNPLINSFNSHGTHVAGILCSSNKSNAPSICPYAEIVSDNGLNNSISYWIAAITDMIINYNAKVINMSLGYNSYIPLSATLGCESTIEYIQNESDFFCSFLNELIEDEFEFVICVAAGNDRNSTVNKISNGVFSYGNKSTLDKLDLFNLYTKKVRECNPEYGLPLNSIENDDVKNRIIVVGACDSDKNMSSYSNIGDRIDIVAPGDMIYSLSLNNEYEYMSGTSMATPFVSGTAALLFASDDTLSGAEVKEIIITSATETVNSDKYNFPVLNVKNALEQVN